VLFVSLYSAYILSTIAYCKCQFVRRIVAVSSECVVLAASGRLPYKLICYVVLTYITNTVRQNCRLRITVTTRTIRKHKGNSEPIWMKSGATCYGNRLLQISSKSVHFRRSYIRTREHRPSALQSKCNIRLKPSFESNKEHCIQCIYQSYETVVPLPRKQ